MACQLIEKERERTKRNTLKVVTCLGIIIVLIVIVIFHKQIFKNLSWESISVIIACLTLIFAIISNQREKRRNILIQKNVRNQKKFEQEIEKILDFYPRMLEEYIKNTNLETEPTGDVENPARRFKLSELDNLVGLNAKYMSEIITINNKIDYLYKFHAEEHPEYDKFKIKINTINQGIEREINNFSILVNECVNNGIGFNYDQASQKVEKRTIYLSNMTNLYQNNIAELYVLANNCIEERNELSLK